MPRAKQHDEVGAALDTTALDEAVDAASRGNTGVADQGAGAQRGGAGRSTKKVGVGDAEVEADGALEAPVKQKQVRGMSASGPHDDGANGISKGAEGSGGPVTGHSGTEHKATARKSMTPESAANDRAGHDRAGHAVKSAVADKAGAVSVVESDSSVPVGESPPTEEKVGEKKRPTAKAAHVGASNAGDGDSVAGTRPEESAKVAPAAKAPAEAKKPRVRTKAETSTPEAPVPAPEVGPERMLFLDHQRELLMSERNNYMRQAEELRAQAAALALEHEPGDVQFDEEGGEGGTANVDRELDLHLSAQAQAAIEEIDAALEKIGSGTYGMCESCGKPIPEARLEALPHARLCVTCKSGGLTARRQ